jgi:CDP-diacylglycerol---glycerol-3-phosphate 3-phosphatidyltransferase
MCTEEATVLNNPAARKLTGLVLEPPARLLIRLRVSPDAVTIVGTVGACVASLAFFPRGQFIPGVIIIGFFVVADLLDGTMARLSGRAGPWGNFLDATLDRIADGCVFGALVLWATTTGNAWTVAAALTALVGGQVISYAKARAEAVGAQANVGLAERAERLIVVLLAALLAGFGVPYVLPIALGIIAIASLITVVQRILVVRRQLIDRGTT